MQTILWKPVRTQCKLLFKDSDLLSLLSTYLHTEWRISAGKLNISDIIKVINKNIKEKYS